MLKMTRGFFKVLIVSLVVLVFASCGNDIKVSNSVYWKSTSTVNMDAGFVELTISGAPGATWRAKIVGGTDWCSFASTGSDLPEVSGFITSDENTLRIYYKSNYSLSKRNASIVFKFDGYDEQSFTLSQTSSYTGFTESPLRVENEDYKYVTHYATLQNRTVRNYSMCYDTSKKAALWVAYPLHPSYQGSVSRTDAWAFDPLINSIYQVNCVNNSFAGSYDRGHQIASADRLATREMNEQTFYMSNMTPQMSRLNQDMWAKLEIKVRSHTCTDTLFVVTGAYFDASGTATTTDGSGTRIPIPTHYFKVLMRTVTGSSGKAIVNCAESEIKTIGFWVEHKSYGNIEPPRSICMSVAQIEAKTGMKFFPLVSQAVKNQNNPSQWGL